MKESGVVTAYAAVGPGTSELGHQPRSSITPTSSETKLPMLSVLFQDDVSRLINQKLS